MKSRTSALYAAIVAVAACGPKAEQPVRNATQPAAPAPAPPIPVANERISTKPQPLPEPRAPIDPKSVEAAGQVVQHYGALIEQGRWLEARTLWSDRSAATTFEKELRPQMHLEIGDLGEPEGAAGSIYTTIPAVFYNAALRKPADIVLRRVNDVPGSTEEQRRWHIERIEWKRP